MRPGTAERGKASDSCRARTIAHFPPFVLYLLKKERGDTMSEPNIQIREAVPDDAAALLAIYTPYVKETAITFEYEVPSVAEFRARIEKTKKKYPYLVV